MKIITLSDAVVTAKMVQGALARQGGGNHTFVQATDKAGVETAAEGEAVLLVDWESGTPAGNAECIRAAKAKLPSLPVLLLSPKALSGTAAEGLKAGAAEVVTKPFSAETLGAAVARATEKKATVNVEFINPFVEGCKAVFTTMGKMEIERKRLFLRDDHKMMGDVSGVMGLSGAAQGNVVVSLSRRLACLVVGNMLGEAPKETVDQDVCDGVGEIINMISGHAKASLVKTKYHFTISIPSVVVGPGHEIAHKRGVPNIVVVFSAMGEEFALQVCLEPSVA